MSLGTRAEFRVPVETIWRLDIILTPDLGHPSAPGHSGDDRPATTGTVACRYRERRPVERCVLSALRL